MNFFSVDSFYCLIMKKGKLFCLNIFYVTVFALLINYAVCDFQYPDVYRNESIEDDFFGTTVCEFLFVLLNCFGKKYL